MKLQDHTLNRSRDIKNCEKNMRMPLSICALCLILGISSETANAGQIDSATKSARFIGAWRLVSLEELGADGKLQRADCTGLLVFTDDERLSVQVMYRAPQPGSSTAPMQYAQGGYEGSFGTYQINDAHTFTFHVEGALVRTLVGKDLRRDFEFTGKQLIVKSADPKEQWRAVWGRD